MGLRDESEIKAIGLICASMSNPPAAKQFPAVERLGIVFLHHRTDEVTLNNLESFRRWNPDATIVTVSPTTALAGGYSIEQFADYKKIWDRHTASVHLRARSADLLLYGWYLNRKEECERWLVVEWDTYCTTKVEKFFEADWERDLVVSRVRWPLKDPGWYWWKSHASLPPDLHRFAAGTVPFSCILIKDAALTAIVEKVPWDQLGECNGELRFGTLANACGFPPIEVSSGKEFIDWEPLAPTSKLVGGLFHPVKWLASDRGAGEVSETASVQSGNSTLTAVILNWKRPGNLREHILPSLEANPTIAEIIVVNNNRSEAPIAEGGKVTILEGSRDFGLDSRFAAALLARCDFVLIQDDDILLPENSIQELLNAAIADSHRLHCCFGRNPAGANTYASNVDRREAEVEMALTRALVVKREHLSLFFEARESPCIKEARGRHKGYGTNAENGEDIILSYAMLRKYERKHRVHALPVKELPTGGVGLSELYFDRFRAHRTEIMRAAQRLPRSQDFVSNGGVEVLENGQSYEDFRIDRIFRAFTLDYHRQVSEVIGVSERISQLHTTLLEFASVLLPKRYGEIGSRFGNSAGAVAIASADTQIRCFDLPDAGWGGRLGSDVCLRRVLSHFAPSRHIVNFGDSRESREKIRSEGPYDLFLIDGNHSAEAALFDFETVLPAMSGGGVIIIDDLLLHPELGDLFSTLERQYQDRWASVERRLELSPLEVSINALHRGIGIFVVKCSDQL